MKWRTNMINNISQLQKRLKENKDSLIFETILNVNVPQAEGTKRKAGIVQTNAFTLLTKHYGRIIDSWIRYEYGWQVKNNLLLFFDTNGKLMVKIKIIEL